MRTAALLPCSLFLLILAPIARVVDAHGYLALPKSRNLLAHERSWPDEVNYCPHCLNLGGRRSSPLVFPETVSSANGNLGLCGDAPAGPSSCWAGGDCPQQVRRSLRAGADARRRNLRPRRLRR